MWGGRRRGDAEDERRCEQSWEGSQVNALPGPLCQDGACDESATSLARWVFFPESSCDEWTKRSNDRSLLLTPPLSP